MAAAVPEARQALLEGSKAPDDEFKDFTNHVLHTRDGLWGGAPEKARAWYQHTVEALRRQGLADGRLLRGRAQPLLHRPADALPHRPVGSREQHPPRRRVEHQSKSYDDLRVQGEKRMDARRRRSLPTGENWLAELVVANARMSNANYEKLIAHYDITRGVSDPPAGLDRSARRMVAELIRFAAAHVRGRTRPRAGRIRRQAAGSGAHRARCCWPLRDPREHARQAHRRRQGARPRPRHVRRTAGHGHSRARRCPRTTAWCARRMPAKCSPSSRRPRQRPRCSPSSPVTRRRPQWSCRAPGRTRAATSWLCARPSRRRWCRPPQRPRHKHRPPRPNVLPRARRPPRQ